MNSLKEEYVIVFSFIIINVPINYVFRVERTDYQAVCEVIRKSASRSEPLFSNVGFIYI